MVEPAVVESEVMDWSEPNPSAPIPFWSSVHQDLYSHVPPDQRAGAPAARWLRGLAIVVRSSGFHVTFLYRVSHQLHHRLGPPGRALAGVIFWFMRHFYGCSIASTARLYGGLILPHPQNLVVGPGVVVGPFAWIFQNVTIGGSPGKVGMPTIGRDARIYTGAVVTGPVTAGDSVMIGANAVLSRDAPSRSIVRCPPPVIEPSR